MDKKGRNFFKSLIIYIHRRDPEKLSNSPNGRSPYSKYHPQPKTKEDVQGGESQYGVTSISYNLALALVLAIYLYKD